MLLNLDLESCDYPLITHPKKRWQTACCKHCEHLVGIVCFFGLKLCGRKQKVAAPHQHGRMTQMHEFAPLMSPRSRPKILLDEHLAACCRWKGQAETTWGRREPLSVWGGRRGSVRQGNACQGQGIDLKTKAEGVHMCIRRNSKNSVHSRSADQCIAFCEDVLPEKSAVCMERWRCRAKSMFLYEHRCDCHVHCCLRRTTLR